MAFQQYNLFDLTSTPFVGLENFRAVLGEDRFWTALRNTGTWVVVSLFFQFFLGFGLALLLRRHFRGAASTRRGCSSRGPCPGSSSGSCGGGCSTGSSA